MGAVEFWVKAVGHTPEDAFQKAIDQAIRLHGIGSYTGTISTKTSFCMVTVPKGKNPEEHARERLEKDLLDKWGPAECVFLGKRKRVKSLIERVPPQKINEEKYKESPGKWRTVYVLTGWKSEEELAICLTKQEATKAARKLALTRQEPVVVKKTMRKHLSDNSFVANELILKVIPERTAPIVKAIEEEVNEYLFYGLAPC